MWPLEQDKIMEQDSNQLEEAEETREQKSCLGMAKKQIEQESG